MLLLFFALLMLCIVLGLIHLVLFYFSVYCFVSYILSVEIFAMFKCRVECMVQKIIP